MKIKIKLASGKKNTQKLTTQQKTFLKKKYSYFIVRQNYLFLTETEKEYLRMLSFMKEF